MLQRKRTGITSVSPCIRPIQTEGGHQYSERKHILMYFFLHVICAFILMALSGYGRWKQLRITSDKNICECRLILSANFRRGWEIRHALDFLQVRTSNPVWQLLLYSLEYNWERIRRSHKLQDRLTQRTKNYANSQSQKWYCSSEKSPSALQTTVLLLVLLMYHISSRNKRL